MLLLNTHKNGKSFKSVNFLLRSRQLASFDSLNKIHFPRSQLILCTFLFPNLWLCGTAATGQKKRSKIVLLHVLTSTLAWLHCSHLLFSPSPFSHFSSVETTLHLCWMLTPFMAQRPIFSLKHRSVLWRQVFFREYYRSGHIHLSQGNNVL